MVALVCFVGQTIDVIPAVRGMSGKDLPHFRSHFNSSPSLRADVMDAAVAPRIISSNINYPPTARSEGTQT